MCTKNLIQQSGDHFLILKVFICKKMKRTFNCLKSNWTTITQNILWSLNVCNFMFVLHVSNPYVFKVARHTNALFDGSMKNHFCISSYVHRISHTHCLLRKSAPWLSLPLIAMTRYLYDWRPSAHRMILALITFALFKYRYINDWWSVSIRISRPYRYSWNLLTAQTIAKHSFSIVEYLHSLFFSFLLPYATRNFNPLSSSNCTRVAQIPLSKAFVWRICL